jgi:hypothetical protein
MRKLAAALLLICAAQSVYPRGIFPFYRHHDHSSGGGAPARHGDDLVPPIPEPETYVMLALGFGVVAWLVRRNKK